MHLSKKILLGGFLFTFLFMSGCGFLPTRTTDLEDPQIKALENAPEITLPETLDLSKYKDEIEFIVIRDPNGDVLVVTLSQEDYKLLMQLFTEVENHVILQRKQLEEVKKFYDQALVRPSVD